jgi:archaellum biogenesis ATPase FlaH
MATHSLEVMFSLLDDVDAVERMVLERFPVEAIPVASLRQVVEWTIEYYFRSGRLQAPSKEAIMATWGQLLDDEQITLGDGTETDTIDWAMDDLRAAHAQKFSGDFAKDFVTQVFEATNPEKVDVIHQAAYDLTTMALKLSSAGDSAEVKTGLVDSIRAYEARVEAGHSVYGCTFGWPQIDEFIGGVHDGELCVIAAGPKTGKSFCLAFIAWHMFLRAKTVVLFTLENSVEMTMDRMICLHLNIDPDRWRKGECTEAEVFRFTEFRDNVLPTMEGTLHVIQPQEGEETVLHMTRQAELLGADVLLIDQLTFVKHPNPGRKPRHEVIGEIMRDLKKAISSGRYRIPCILAHQINREGVKQARKEGFLTMEMLAEASEVERTSDFVFGLYQSQEQRQLNMSMLQMLATRRTDYRSWSMLWNINAGLVSVIGEVQVQQ